MTSELTTFPHKDIPEWDSNLGSKDKEVPKNGGLDYVPTEVPL